MTRTLSLALTTAALVAAAPAVVSGQTLNDPSFEDVLVTDGTDFGSNWFAFAADGTTNSSATLDTSMPRTGDQALNLTINGDDNSFTGVFQEVAAVSPGDTISFSVFGKTDSVPLGPVIYFFAGRNKDGGGRGFDVGS